MMFKLGRTILSTLPPSTTAPLELQQGHGLKQEVVQRSITGVHVSATRDIEVQWWGDKSVNVVIQGLWVGTEVKWGNDQRHRYNRRESYSWKC